MIEDQLYDLTLAFGELGESDSEVLVPLLLLHGGNGLGSLGLRIVARRFA